jgi:hypothetical protein
MSISAAALGASIFDETEQPPVPQRAAGPLAPRIAAPATGPAAAGVQWPRLAIPSAAQQSKVRKQCRDVFAKDLADGSATGRRALAERLLKDAGGSRDTVERYVLLTAARLAAIELADVSLCYRAVDALAAMYDIDAARLKLEVALKCLGKSESAAVTAENCRLALGLIDALVAVDDVGGALRLGGLTLPSVAGDPLLGVLVEKRIKECETIKLAREQLAPSLERLRSAPDDAGANLAVGMFLCFTREDWPAGLPMLTKGLDQRLRQLSERELDPAKDATAIAQLADDWWDWAQRQNEPTRTVARKHAVALYGQGLRGASGVRKEAIEKRIAEASHMTSQRLIDLLPLADPKRGSIHGAWMRAVEQAGLLSPTGVDQFALPYEPPEEYIFRIEFTRLKGNEGLGQIVTKGGTPFTWAIGMSHGEVVGIDAVKGKPVIVSENPTRVSLQNKLEDKHRYVSTIEVRNGRVRGWLDGRLLVDWKTDYRDLSPHDRGGWAPVHASQLGLCTWNSQTVFHRIEVLELTGEGKVIK